MAYLRGNTYVDGSLNVEGSLIIDSVASSSGNVPFYIDTIVKSKIDSILKVHDSDGGISSTDLYTTRKVQDTTQGTQNPIAEGVAITYDLRGDGGKLLLDNTHTRREGVLKTVFKLDVKTMQWKFYNLFGEKGSSEEDDIIIRSEEMVI